MTEEQIVKQLSNFIWQIADLLRGPYRPPQYERVMLPLVVLRRFDCVLEPTKDEVIAEHKRWEGRLDGPALDERLNAVAGQRFHNHSELTFEKLKGDPERINDHLVSYIQGFSQNVRDIFDRFEFDNEIVKMSDANILYLVVTKFCEVDLHPEHGVTNSVMGSLFEDLIRRFNEAANEQAGDHFTPREVIELMVDILFEPDDEILTTKGKVFTLLDPACGTGGMLSVSQKHLRKYNGGEKLWVFGQDYNPRSYAVAASDLLLKDSENSRVELGDSLIDDKFEGETFDYLLANPPFGVDWKKQRSEIKREHDKEGFSGRFGAGLPRVNDGALLFLQHMISKFQPYGDRKDQDGSRLAIVFNGSPLFTGGAGSGESEIRKWIIENDWLEAIIALPIQMFYNTDIATYVWVVTNRKKSNRKGRIQLIDARERWIPMQQSLGDKRRKMSEEDIAAVVREYGSFQESSTSKIFYNTEFGYSHIAIERPLRLMYEMNPERKDQFLNDVSHLVDDVQAIDAELGRQPWEDWNTFYDRMMDLLMQRGSSWKKSEVKLFRKVFTSTHPDAKRVVESDRKPSGDPNARVWGWFLLPKEGREVYYEADSDLRDFESVPVDEAKDKFTVEEGEEDVVVYFHNQVEPYVSDSWANRERFRRAYEINFNRYFYVYNPPPSLKEIDTEIEDAKKRILRLLNEITDSRS